MIKQQQQQQQQQQKQVMKLIISMGKSKDNINQINR